MKYKPKNKNVENWKEYLTKLGKEHPINAVIKNDNKCQQNQK
jgi:hypothetical protein